MRKLLALLSVAATCVSASTLAQRGADDGFDDRGYDRHDRTPDWNYRRGESEAKGAYYDGGRYGPRGLTGGSGASRLDPWLAQTGQGARLVLRKFDREGDGRIGPGVAAAANRWFRRYADTDRNRMLTDAEIVVALATLDQKTR